MTHYNIDIEYGSDFQKQFIEKFNFLNTLEPAMKQHHKGNVIRIEKLP